MYYIKYSYSGLKFGSLPITYKTYKEAKESAQIKQNAFLNESTVHKLNFEIIEEK